MKPAIIFAVFRRELLDIVRDRRALWSSVLISVLALPLLMGFVSFFLGRSIERSRSEATTVAVVPALAAPYQSAVQKAGLRLVELANESQVRDAVLKQSASTGLLVSGDQLSFRVLVESTNPGSSRAASKLQTALNEVKAALVLARLQSVGLDATALQPIQVTKESLTTEKTMGGFILGSIAGYLVILSMFSRVLGISISVTVGEKQRGTMESLVASPAPRAALAIGKALTCSGMALFSGLLSVGSLLLTSSTKSLQIEGVPSLVGEIPLDLRGYVLLFTVLVCLSVFAGTLVLSIASAARSSKEAQTYLSPLLMLSFFPALLGGLPGMEISPALSWIPILNASQLMKSIFQGEFLPLPFILTCATNLLYGSVAMAFGIRNFESDKITRRT